MVLVEGFYGVTVEVFFYVINARFYLNYSGLQCYSIGLLCFIVCLLDILLHH